LIAGSNRQTQFLPIGFNGFRWYSFWREFSGARKVFRRPGNSISWLLAGGCPSITNRSPPQGSLYTGSIGIERAAIPLLLCVLKPLPTDLRVLV
jgi:hypothetical protein